MLEYEFYPHSFLNFHLRIPGLFYDDTTQIIDRMSQFLAGSSIKLKQTKELKMPEEVKKKLDWIVERTDEDESQSSSEEEEWKEEKKVRFEV